MNTNKQPHGKPASACKQQQARAALCDAAIRLFLAHGYEATTVDHIAQTAGISRRTFFRHYPSKDDAVMHSIDEMTQAALAALRGHEDKAEPPINALKRAMHAVIAQYGQQQLQDIERLIRGTPSLAAARLALQQRCQAQLAIELGLRYPALSCEQARLTTAVAMATLETALPGWLDTKGGTHDNLAHRVDAMFNLLPTLCGMQRSQPAFKEMPE